MVLIFQFLKPQIVSPQRTDGCRRQGKTMVNLFSKKRNTFANKRIRSSGSLKSEAVAAPEGSLRLQYSGPIKDDDAAATASERAASPEDSNKKPGKKMMTKKGRNAKTKSAVDRTSTTTPQRVLVPPGGDMEERDGDGDGTPGAAFSKQQQEQQGEKRAPKNNGMVPYEEEGEEEATFASLGLCDWILTACKAMGFRRPTPVQRRCIPAILEGKDVLGCAETGSGKTAAFALPILHELSKEPYGVFAVVLTPTRELAVQISEQFGALGALMGLRHAVVIGGVGQLEQSLELAERPHVVVATPGRLRDHLQGPAAPALRKCRYLVLDEADRLLAPTFQGELRCIAQALPQSRQTLLFSATMTSNLQALESLALSNPVKYDLTKKATVPATLTQEYLFMPQQMKTCFVVETLRVLASDGLWSDPEDREKKRKRGSQGGGGNSVEREEEEEDVVGSGKARSVMIFVSKCRRCQELSETLLELGVDCTPLHSLLGQRRRMAALGKFKSQQTKVLISTDVASRGLDIPAVDLVVNFDVPRVATDYVHRVGRTARAGRRGRAITLVSQYDIELVHNIEQYTGTPLVLCPVVSEDDVLKLLNRVAKASRVAKMRLMEQGFDERESSIKERNNRRRDSKVAGAGDSARGGASRSS
ncbi:unnamed protein product [Ascophyllum nodosum]